MGDMDLALEDMPRLMGRANKEISATIVRELVPADLALLEVERGVQKVPALKRISERHHRLARSFASGMSDTEASLVTGYTVSRISLLRDDPQMQELIAFCKNELKDHEAEITGRLIGVSVTALDEIADRLEDDEQRAKMSVGQLQELSKMGLDRVGHGPSTTTNQNHSITVDIASRTEAARKRIEARKIIDVTPEESKP